MNAQRKGARRSQRQALGVAALPGASPEIGAPTLTVGQIVEQLGSLAFDTQAMNERIRHWTREGLLHPVDLHHAGTGKHRRYGPDAVFEAAVLNALATAGLQVVSRPYVKTILTEVRKALKKYRATTAAGHKAPPFFLTVSHDLTQPGGEPTATLSESAVKYDSAADVAIVIKLSQLFARTSR
jgi:hypothetical protein